MRFRYLLLLLLLSFVCCEAIRAAEPYYFRHYNNKDGLSHNTVYSSLQDRKGFLWFGTDDGLNRFDGYTFTIYRHDPAAPAGQTLPGNYISYLFEDSEGRIWISTNRGACYFDYATDSFHPLVDAIGENVTENFIAIYEDQQKNLWFVAYNRILKYIPADHSLKVYPASDHFWPTQIAKVDNGMPLFCDYAGLYMYRPDTDRFQHYPILPREIREDQVVLSVIHPVADVGVFIGTNKSGLLLYHWQSREVETIIPGIQVRDITAYNSNTYWIASESGVYIYNLINKTITHLTKSLTNNYAIADNAIYSITKDREGGMWIGSFFGGISYLSQSYTPFQYFIGGKTHPQMPGNAVREICSDQYGNLWFGTEDNGINRYDLRTGEITNYSQANPRHTLSATNVHGLYARGDKLWVGTFHKGIDVLDIPTGRIVQHFSQANTNQALLSDFILCFYETSEGEFFIGTSAGLMEYDSKTNTLFPYKITRSLIRQIYEDRHKRLWLVTSHGIHMQQADRGEILHFTAENTNGQLDNNTTSLFEDSRGNIWVTTTSGFSRYNETENSFTRITLNEELPSNILYRIVEDNEGRLWITTANGLVRYEPASGNIRVFSNKDGLHETQFNYSSSYKAPDGTIYLGTVNGMVSFRPQRFRADTYVPPLYINRIQIPGDEVLQQSVQRRIASNASSIRLPYQTSTFTLSYAALNFTSPEAVQYAYKLEGVNREWIPMGTNREVTFAKLSPGSYTFKVRSTNTGEEWQENTAALTLIITPPFWMTGWAWIAYFLILCGCAWMVYSSYKRKLERQKLREQQQFFTFITHEIRTPLTLIKAPLEKLLHSGEGSPTMRRQLRTVEKNAQRLLDLSNQLLDFRKTSSRAFRLNFVPSDVSLLLETTIQPFRPVFESEGKRLTELLPEQSLQADLDREAFIKIISNLLSNALKYSREAIIVKLAFSTENKGHFILAVTNDGPLIPETEREIIFEPFYRLKDTGQPGSGIGLSLSRTLAEYHGGTLRYQPTPDGLNRFLLTLPLEQTDTAETPETVAVPVAKESPEAKPAATPATILVVEDQTDMLQFIVEELSGDYHVLEAENGQEALQLLDKNNVNLILSDVMMPVMDGFELCNRLKNDINYSHIPLILLTAQHNQQSHLEGLNRGADAYMEKPFSIELLNAQIRNLLASRERLGRSYREKPQTPTQTLAVSPVDTLFLERLNVFLDENLTNEALSVELLAEAMNMSVSSLYRKVKGLSGLSPVDFIRVTRLKKAVTLMEAGEKRIAEVAYKCGFSSPAYFSSCFQKQYGMAPSEYGK
ncbi:response regulator [Parabacteroides sp. OttesenSCG-928-G21]|nr:response regulator [Parabacteroides sp. OttesenSCG-928-G21]